MELARLPDSRLTLARPLAVDVLEEDGAVVCWSEDAQVAGIGNTVEEAIEDLGYAVAGTYRFLRDHSDRLGPEMESLWQHLRGLVSELT